MKFAAKLLADTKGNIFYMTAFFMVPLLALIGGGLDVGRAYLVHNRLQNACDAGVLAARKAQRKTDIMMDYNARTVGKDFFSHNFTDGTLGIDTTNQTFKVTAGSSDNTVAGEASVVLDNAIMGIFGFDSIPLSVKCEAEFDAINLDIMLVLDTTLSMQRMLGGERKIVALRKAVKKFYDVVSATADTPHNRVRYGFLPYAGTVNVGYMLTRKNPAWVVGGGDSSLDKRWLYHSRFWDADSSSYKYGFRNYNLRTYVRSMQVGTPRALLPYEKDTDHAPRWEGCIEEAATKLITPGDTTIPADAYDMQLDHIPNVNDIETRWKPHWRSATYVSWTGRMADSNCPKTARKLREYPTWNTDGLGNYIAGLDLHLGTNQVSALTWGTRLMSPDGIFGNENRYAPNGEDIARHLVFMTDGRLWFSKVNYSTHGMNYRHGLLAPQTASETQIKNNGYARMALICDAIKAKGITIWAVEFENDTSVSSSLLDCATSPDHAFAASNSQELSNAFAAIGSQISGLRLSK